MDKIDLGKGSYLGVNLSVTTVASDDSCGYDYGWIARLNGEDSVLRYDRTFLKKDESRVNVWKKQGEVHFEMLGDGVYQFSCLRSRGNGAGSGFFKISGENITIITEQEVLEILRKRNIDNVYRS